MIEITKQLAVIGIDSFDPRVLLAYREQLPTLSRMIDESPTFTARSVFPVDTIPAWVTIYTGRTPANHGLLYVYDVFDPHLSDLAKLDLTTFQGGTFWDYASQEGRRAVIVMPHLVFPAWRLNGVMVSRSPFDKRIDTLRTTREVSTYPASVQYQYAIPNTLADVWGQFPGKRHLRDWIALQMNTIEAEKRIGLQLFTAEQWDLFFIYFSTLDAVQHRLWRFFDKNDPTHSDRNPYRQSILDFYVAFDSLIAEFQSANRSAQFVVMSDHGHKIRPVKTVNINEHLKNRGYLAVRGKNERVKSRVRKLVLEVANQLNLEPTLIRLITSLGKITATSKSVYSGSGSIDKRRSSASLSTFAGIKSYSFGGLEINRELVSETEYPHVLSALQETLLELNAVRGEPVITWVKKRDEVCAGAHSRAIYPDLLFELRDDFGVGWDLFSGLFGKAYDHNVASGGHGKLATLLITGAETRAVRDNISIVDSAPSILDLLGIDWHQFVFDGRSVFV